MSETVISWSPPNIISIALMMFVILVIIGAFSALIMKRKTAND